MEKLNTYGSRLSQNPYPNFKKWQKSEQEVDEGVPCANK